MAAEIQEKFFVSAVDRIVEQTMNIIVIEMFESFS